MSATVKRIVLRTSPAVGSTAQFSALERCRTYAASTTDAAASAQASSNLAQLSSNVAVAARDAALGAVGAVKASPTDTGPATLDEALVVSAPLAKQVLSPGGNESLSLSVSAVTGADASNPGLPGLVPAPQAGDQGRFLRGDATWQALEDTWTPLAGPVSVLSATQAAVPGNQLTLVLPGGATGRAVKPDDPAGAFGCVADASYDSQNDRTLVTVYGFALGGQTASLMVGQDPRNAPASSSTGSDLYLAATYGCLTY